MNRSFLHNVKNEKGNMFYVMAYIFYGFNKIIPT